MSTSYTTNTNLQQPATSDRYWDVPMNANTTYLDSVSAIGQLAVALTEVPSTTLHVKVSAGVYEKSTGALGTYAGTTSQTLTASATNYIYLTDAGTLTVSTSSFPASAFHVRLATVICGVSSVTSITDSRVVLASNSVNFNTVYMALAGGTFADGTGVVTVETGTTNGVKFGGSASSKIGFLGATPVIQQTGGSATASSSYTATEQSMLQKAYNALRTFGLLS